MQITFRKSLLAALLSGTVAVVTPVLAGTLVMAQTGGTSTTTNGSASGAVNATQPKAGASASGATSATAPDSSSTSDQTSGSVSTQSNGTYGGVNDTTSVKAKSKASDKKPSEQTPSATPNGNASEAPQSTSQPHN